MQKKLFVVGGVFALLSVALGAMGAHALKEKLEPAALDAFNTGVKFMFYHALALLVFGLIADKIQSKLFAWAGNLIVWGTVLFSGSIYLLSTKSLAGIDYPKIFGLVTPLGGTLLIAGWALFIFSIIQNKKV